MTLRPALSPCGVDCGSCPFLGENCGGCAATKGKPFYIKDFNTEICPLYDCPVNKKGLETCGPCAELPCEIYHNWRDPSMTDEQHLDSINERVKILKAL